MERPAEIGKSIVIKGDLTAREDIVISGRVEGSITVEGHSVTVKDGAELVADIKARTILIGGEVMGTLIAVETIELQPSADVEGELKASALRVHEGAVFTGKHRRRRRGPRPSCSWRPEPRCKAALKGCRATSSAERPSASHLEWGPMTSRMIVSLSVAST